MINLKIDTPLDTQKLAILISKMIGKNDVLLLKGNLGSGKTTFAQYLIKSLSKEQHVQSPTFNIVNVYESNIGQIWHYDLYRVKNAEELNEIGLEESLSSGISIIEWPELVENIIYNDRIIIYFDHDTVKNIRQATIKLHGRFLESKLYLEKKIKDEFR